jgi:hypothetical protein
MYYIFLLFQRKRVCVCDIAAVHKIWPAHKNAHGERERERYIYIYIYNYIHIM